jgi:CHAT domain-containing protein/Tfp pilus assembly protein PilF
MDRARAVLIIAIALLLVPGATTTALAASPLYGSKRMAKWTQPSAVQSQPTDVRDLEPGQRIEREMQSAESHCYRVTLIAGQCVTVVVSQQNIDLEVEAFDPAGKAIAEIKLRGKDTSESLWALAEAGGDYRIRIAAASQSRGAYGRYILTFAKVAELESAPSSDQAYVRAQRLLFEGNHLSARGGEQSLRQASERFQEALPLWRALKDSGGEAITLHGLGYVYGGLGEPQKSLDTYAQALLRWQDAKNRPEEQADTLYNMGSVYSSAGRVAEAVDCFRKAIELRRSVDNQSGMAFALTNLGQVYINVGEFQEALKSHQEALRLRRAIGEVEGEARSLSNVSGVYFRLGEFQEALNYCKQALPLRRAAKDRRGEAITLTNIGSIYRELGELQKGLEYHQQALSLVRVLKDANTEAAMLDAIGRSYYELGDYLKALESHRQALSLRPTGEDAYAEASALANIGNAYARMGERDKALAFFEQSLKLRRTIGDRRGEALTLQNAGELLLESGESQKALVYFNQGLALSRAIKNRAFEANLLYDIARVEQRDGHTAEALPRIEAAISIIESTRTKVTSADLRASFLASKQDFYELEIDLLMQSYRCDHSQESLTKAFSVSEQRRARSLLDSLEEARTNIRQGVSPELLISERASRAKLNQLAESQIRLLSGKHSPEQAAASAREVDAITAEYEQILTEIRVSSPRYASLTQPAPLSLRDIQTEVLDPDTLLLEYTLGKERSYLLAVTSTTITGFQLPPRARIELLGRNLYDLMTSRSRLVKFEESQERRARIRKADAEYAQTAGELSRMLLGPVAGQMMRSKRLLIVSDGALQYLPFAALPLPATSAPRAKPSAFAPLIAEHEVISLPSASTLAVLRKEIAGRKPAPKTIAVLADPVFDKNDERVKTKTSELEPDRQLQAKDKTQAADGIPASEMTRPAIDLGLADKQLRFPRLPFTRQEASAITALAPPEENKTATDFEANRATAMAPEMSQYRYVHFATHGLLNNTHPELSGIVLSLVDEGGRESNGFLSTNEIYNLNLPAEMIVLSGCRTGLGKELKGEGILGLTRAFMYAGAPRVLVSLWDVSDESTLELMARFYSGILGEKRLSPAAALREAQLSMLRSARWRMPYFWSAFVLQGEYR